MRRRPVGQTRSLAHEPTKDQLQSPADQNDQVAQAGRNAQGRMDSLERPKNPFVYKAIYDRWEYCDRAHRDAKQTAEAAGDNDEDPRLAPATVNCAAALSE